MPGLCMAGFFKLARSAVGSLDAGQPAGSPYHPDVVCVGRPVDQALGTHKRGGLHGQREDELRCRDTSSIILEEQDDGGFEQQKPPFPKHADDQQFLPFPKHADAEAGTVSMCGQPCAEAGGELERLRAIFATNDGLQVLVSHHVDKLVESVIRAMRPRSIPSGEVVIHQGWESRSMYIVDEGIFDVWLEQAQGPSVKVCQYGPGTVFGERAMATDEPRPATVVAATPARVWVLERECFQSLLKAPDGTKTIRLAGGVMLLINNLAGPTIVLMPALAQEAGWLSILLVQATVSVFAAACGYMLIDAMRGMPGNENFEQRIEFTNLASFYLPRPAYLLVMMCYHVNSIMTLMSLIIQSGQVIDYVILNFNGCAPGIAIFGREFGYVCGTRTDSATPFGDVTVISSSLAVVAVVCAPFAVKNLDDNVVLQYLAILGLTVMAICWICLLTAEPDFPQPLPVATWSQGPLIGTVLFNFAFTSTLPSWVNEKRPDVSVAWSFGLTLGYVVIIYTVLGIIGGMAYKPFFMTDENMFSKLNAGGSALARVTVTSYPMLQNFTSIPVFSILIRYNLMQSGLSRRTATMLAVVLPWLLSIPFYTGSGFETISEYGGLATSSVINFIVPAAFYGLARWHQHQLRKSS